MYERFYGLRERPFDLTPNPRFLFMTAQHREALTTLESGRMTPDSIFMIDTRPNWSTIVRKT